MATKILHLDASLGVTVDGSSKITQWNDQSGNGYNLTATNFSDATDGKGTLVINQLNGKPIVRFPLRMQVSLGTTLTTDVVFFMVVKYTGTNINGNSWFDNAGIETVKRLSFSRSGQVGASGRIIVDTSDINPTNSISPVNNTWYMIKGGMSASALKTYCRVNRNGGSWTNGGTQPSFTKFLLGNYYSAGHTALGDMVELILYSSITDTEANDVEQILNTKYALGLDNSLDFITLEEEQLYSPRLDEALVDFVTLEEEQLPLAIPEELQEFSVEEKDLDFTTLEIILDESVDRSDPVTTDITLVESLDPFTIPVPVKIMVQGGSRVVLGKLI